MLSTCRKGESGQSEELNESTVTMPTYIVNLNEAGVAIVGVATDILSWNSKKKYLYLTNNWKEILSLRKIENNRIKSRKSFSFQILRKEIVIERENKALKRELKFVKGKKGIAPIKCNIQ